MDTVSRAATLIGQLREVVMIDIEAQRCAGIDIGKAEVVVAVHTPGPGGGRRRQTRTYTTMTRELLMLRDWLIEEKVTRVGMEATGVYWKPVFYLLEDAVDECWLLNPQHVKARRRGRKTDVIDAEWICQMTEHGLVAPSLVPPPPVRRLRLLTRRRASLVSERTREKNRMQAMLEDAGIKLGVVATDVFGVSGRRILDALIAGQRDPHVLADLAVGTLVKKHPALIEALTGRFDDYHALLAGQIREHVDYLDAAIAQLDGLVDQLIDTEIAPFRHLIDLLITLPGVAYRTAQVILAETGGDMTVFPTPGHLAAWAGVCPGQHASAGQKKNVGAPKANKWLRRALGEAATACARTHTHLGARYKRLAARRGRNRAKLAVGHSILTATWTMITTDRPHHDLGEDHYIRRTSPDRRRRQLITQLQQLGYDVAVTPKPDAA
jgi:transposase